MTRAGSPPLFPAADRNPLRVAFNATPLLSPLTGIGNYIVQLGRALEATAGVDPYSFYRYRWRHESPRAPDHAGDGGPSIVRKLKPWLPFRSTLRRLAQGAGFSRGLRRHRIQLYHEQNYIPLSYDVPVVITIHDLSWLRYPQTHPADRVRWLERGLPRALERASAIVVDSEFVRSEVVSVFGVPPERVTTAHLGVSNTFRPRTEQEIGDTLRKLGLRYRGYVLVVATIEPRKNLARVLEAFTELAPSLRERCPLVVAGAPGWRGGPLVSRLNRVADRGHVRFLGHVGSRELPGLYAGAALFVFPSLYEGFGLPPLEAMASGVPVIVSDRASLPEVVGDAGRMVDPERPDEIAACIAGLLDDEGARRQMASRGLERASLFTWDACARVTLGVYRDVLGPAIRGDANVNGLARRSL